MSGRGPDPKDLRASLVDSGWSVTPPPAEAVQVHAPVDAELLPEELESRRLPNYEDLSQAVAVTQIDADIQTRLKAMQRVSLADAHRPPLPPARVGPGLHLRPRCALPLRPHPRGPPPPPH